MRTTFTLPLSYRSRPKCPICQRPLRSECVEVVDGVLFCNVCSGTLPDRANVIAEHLRSGILSRHASISHGVVAYTPHACPPCPADELPELFHDDAKHNPTAATRPLPRTQPPA